MHCGDAGSGCTVEVSLVVCGTKVGMDSDRPLFMNNGARSVCCGEAGIECNLSRLDREAYATT